MALTGIIAGLGNPGSKYEHTRHNLGFQVVDGLVADAQAGRIAGGSVAKVKETKKYVLWRLSLGPGAGEWLLLKPLTFMNLSGEAVAEVAHYYDIEPERILAVHDELDLPLGRMKLKTGGGTAGHNGLKSMAQCLGTRDFARLRLGIGKPERGETTGWVLGTFRPEERTVAAEMLDAAREGVLDFIFRPRAEATERVNGFRAPSAAVSDD